MAAKDELGRRGEEVAARRLRRSGLIVLDRNWRCGAGELDIVARDGPELVIVEVKTRSSMAFGDPFTAITPEKRARLWRLAAAWREAHPQFRPASTRLDVIAVLLPRAGEVVVDHLRDLR